jgi:hypothetical protein
MVTKPLGGSDYVPKRGESESSSDSSDSDSSNGEDESSEEGISDKGEESKTSIVTGKEEFEGEGEARKGEKSRSNTPSSYKEALMKTTSKKTKAKIPNSLERSNLDTVPGEPMKIFDSDILSEIDIFDRLDYQRRKSENQSSNSIGSLTLESPEPMKHRKQKGKHARSPMGEVEGMAIRDNHLSKGKHLGGQLEKEIVPPRLQSS